MQKNNSALVRKSKPKAVRVNVSMPHRLRDAAEWVCTVKGYSGLSDYLQAYLRRDAALLGAKQFDLAPPNAPICK